MGLFTTPQNLVDTLSPGTFLAYFDDNNTGNVATVMAGTAVGQVLASAHAMVLSYLIRIYPTMPPELPAPVSNLLSTAELQFAQALTMDRHPEFSATLGKTRDSHWTAATTLMENIADAKQEIAPNDNPPPGESPATDGGLIYDNGPRMLTDADDGTDALGDF